MTFAVCKACGAGAERDQRIFDALGVTVDARGCRGERKAERKRDDAMTTKPRAEDFLALTLFNNDDRRVMLIDFDDLAKRFGKETANRMLDALVPDPQPRPKDWLVEMWAARGSVGLVFAGADPLHAISQLAGLAVAIGYDKPWGDLRPSRSGPVLFVTTCNNAGFVNLALTARRNNVGAQARRTRLAVLGVEMLAQFDGEPHLTNNWHDLLNQMDVLKPAFVIIDGRNGVLVGDDRGAARWFGTLACTLARLRNCAVLLLVDSDGEEDADRWNGCADFKFAFSGSADGETMRAALAAAVAEGALQSMPR
jgi:AAA domain